MTVKWYLPSVLNCISLSINVVKHQFTCLLDVCVSSLEKCCFKLFACFFKLDFKKLLSSGSSSLTLDINTLIKMISKYLLPFCGLCFILLVLSFDSQQFNLDEVQFIFSFIDCAIDTSSNHCQTQTQRLSFKRFTVLALQVYKFCFAQFWIWYKGLTSSFSIWFVTSNKELFLPSALTSVMEQFLSGKKKKLYLGESSLNTGCSIGRWNSSSCRKLVNSGSKQLSLGSLWNWLDSDVLSFPKNIEAVRTGETLWDQLSLVAWKSSDLWAGSEGCPVDCVVHSRFLVFMSFPWVGFEWHRNSATQHSFLLCLS